MRCKTTNICHILMLFTLINVISTQRYVRQTTGAADVNDKNSNSNSNNNNSYHQPHFMGNRSVIVQLFEWKFVDIATECRTFLGPQGYAGVQISPALEHTVVKTEQLKHPWWERYELVSYRLASRSGDESEFWSMSRICNEHGVRIYVDVVLNHMAAPLHLIVKDYDNKDFMVNTLLETNVNISQSYYANVTYSKLDFHSPQCEVLANAQDAHEIRNCQLNGHPDLDHSRGVVQKHIVKMMNKFIDMGVAGFRIDTAKYMWPIDLRNIYQQLNNLNREFNFEPQSRPFIYHDVFDLGLDTVSKTEYTTYGVVSEYLYSAELATIFNGKAPLSSLINWGPALGFLPSADALVFIDSHDTQRGLPTALGHNHFLTYKQRVKYIMANVFMLAHPYGAIKRIMSSYYFKEDINQGPPTEDEEGEEIRSPKFNKQQQCTKASGWVCEHRWPALIAMVHMANYFAAPGQQEESIVYFQTNGPNQVAFCRGSQAFVAINNDRELDFNMEVYACLEPGTYCDVVSGGRKEQSKDECHGKKLVINEKGYAKLQLAVPDGNQIGIDDEMENEIEEEEVMEDVEEETGIIESYGILVIYKGSKIEATTSANKEDGAAQKSNDTDGDSEDEQREEVENPESAQVSSKEVEGKAAEGEVNNTEESEQKQETEEANEADVTKESDDEKEKEEDLNLENVEENKVQDEVPPDESEEKEDDNESESNKEEETQPDENDNENDMENAEADKNKEVSEEVIEEDASEKNEIEEADALANEVPETEEPAASLENSNEPEVEVVIETTDTTDNTEKDQPEDLDRESTEDNTETVVEVTELNQSRNLEDSSTEEQVERPSADIVENSTEEKAKKVIVAGLLSNSKQNDHNG